MNQKKKKIAMIIASQEFRDEECFETKAILEDQDFKITLFSDKKGIAIGRFGGEIEVKKTLNEINVDDFNCLLFVGGGGALKYLDNDLSYKIINEANSKSKVLAAICIAPVILAKAGTLKNRKTTVWSSNLDKSAIEILKDNGAIYVNEDAVIDKNIITASGPLAIQEFCKKIIEVYE